MNLVTEKELQNTVTEIFETAGYLGFHVNDSRKEVRTGEGYQLVGDAQAAGYPDLTIAGRGEAIWSELKSQRRKLKPEQVEWLDALPAHQAHVWRPEDLGLAVKIASSGRPADGTTCWTCHREEILKRVGVKRRKSRKNGATPGRR